MALGQLTLTLQFVANVSVQPGDIMYYSDTSSIGTHTHVLSANDIYMMGKILTITRNATNTVFTLDYDLSVPLPTTGAFFSFSKDNLANCSSLLGYFMEVKFVNNSTKKAELFSAGTEMSVSSK